MSDVAIRVENLGKRYRIGLEEELNDTLIGTLNSWVKAPVRNFRRLRKLSHFGSEDTDDVIWALKDVSFEVERGEVLGIIGRNGAGKSTLLKVLSRITEPTEGRAVINGRVASLLEVGTGFHSELTGRENVYLNGTVLGMTRAEVDAKFDEIVAFSGVERFIDTPVKRYSSGMKVRLAFAVAAHLEPEILLIDEVLAVGDYSFQQKCLGKMEQIADKGRTVLFVSHQMDMVRSLCERIIWLKDGHKIAGGDPEEVVTKYIADATKDVAEHASFERELDAGRPAQLVGGRLMDDTDEVRTTFDVFDPITIELDYALRDVEPGMMLYLCVARDRGSFLWSFDTDTEPERLENRRPGRYRYRVELPCPLLKPGRYSVSVGVGIANRHKVDHVEHALRFKVQLLSQPSALLSYATQRPGAVAASLEWREMSSG